MKIKIISTIEIDENFFDEKDPESLAWFESLLNDSDNTILQLWSNDIGDEIGQSKEFKYEIIK